MNAAVAAPASRNSPCPCNSGKRYKDCHGAIGRPGAAGDGNAIGRPQHVLAARSRYRAPGAEWSHLPQDEHDALGALMEEALRLQQTGQVDRAEALYRKVLVAAPDTHDALHMLGVILYDLRNFDGALELILRARSLRPTYEAIDRNLALVRAAVTERKRAVNEQLAELALPALCELINSRTGRLQPRSTRGANSRVLHLIGRATAAGEDDAWILSRLAEVLAPLAPIVWAADVDFPFSSIPEGWNVLDYSLRKYPRDGTHVFVGIDFNIGAWVRHSNPDRVVVVCNRGRPSAYIRQLRAMAVDGLRAIEPVFMSHARAQRFGSGYLTIPVPGIGTAFAPPAVRRGAFPAASMVGVIGQISDQVEEPDDAQILTEIAVATGSLTLFDPGRYRFLLGTSQKMRFVARSEQTLEEFIASIECLYCRPTHWWDEGIGREVLTAMAFGKPVICPRASVHAGIFDDRVDGLLYDTHEESLTLLDQVRHSPSWAEQIANAAQAKVQRLMGEGSDLARYEALTGKHAQSTARVANGC